MIIFSINITLRQEVFLNLYTHTIKNERIELTTFSSHFGSLDSLTDYHKIMLKTNDSFFPF